MFYSIYLSAATAAAAAGVEVEWSFIFGLAAMRPQFGQKRQRRQSFYVEIATSNKKHYFLKSDICFRS